MSTFDYGRALGAAGAYWLCTEVIDAILGTFTWFVNVSGAYTAIPFAVYAITHSMLVFSGLLAAWFSCSVWYFRRAPVGLLHGAALGFTFSCIALVMTVVENQVRLWAGFTTLISLDRGILWMISFWIVGTGIMGMVFKRRGVPFDTTGERLPKVNLVRD